MITMIVIETPFKHCPLLQVQRHGHICIGQKMEQLDCASAPDHCDCGAWHHIHVCPSPHPFAHLLLHLFSSFLPSPEAVPLFAHWICQRLDQILAMAFSSVPWARQLTAALLTIRFLDESLGSSGLCLSLAGMQVSRSQSKTGK